MADEGLIPVPSTGKSEAPEKLKAALQSLFAEGVITGNSEAEVDDWQMEIVDRPSNEQVSVVVDAFSDASGTESDLDEAVADCCDSSRATINNSGLAGQIEFLLRNGFGQEAILKLAGT